MLKTTRRNNGNIGPQEEEGEEEEMDDEEQEEEEEEEEERVEREAERTLEAVLQGRRARSPVDWDRWALSGGTFTTSMLTILQYTILSNLIHITLLLCINVFNEPQAVVLDWWNQSLTPPHSPSLTTKVIILPFHQCVPTRTLYQTLGVMVIFLPSYPFLLLIFPLFNMDTFSETRRRNTSCCEECRRIPE